MRGHAPRSTCHATRQHATTTKISLALKHNPGAISRGQPHQGGSALAWKTPGELGICVEALGGSLDQLYWTAHDGAAHAIADLPDSASAMTVANTAFKTGAFTSVKAQELLTEAQLSDTLTLTQCAQQVYEAPGKAAVEPA